MTDKKLTDSEIIEDLKLWIDLSKRTDTPPFITHLFLQQILDLINRLQARIDLFADIGKMHSEIKTEAYKEFAELVHCHCQDIINQPHNEKVKPLSWKVAYEEFDEYIDNLLKEMVGDNNES